MTFDHKEARALVERLTEVAQTVASRKERIASGICGQTIEAMARSTFREISDWELEALYEDAAALTAALAEIERLETQIRSLDHALNFILSDAAWTPKHLVCESIIACINALRKGDDQ